MKFEKEIKAYALKNALEFGRAKSEKILPKLFQHGLEKSDIKEIMSKIIATVNEINSISKEKQEKEFEKYKDLIPEKEEKKHELPELPNPTKNMVFRLAPFPSGALHIGNAKTYLLNALYAEKYNGKILFVIDDTIGSKEKQIMPDAYDLIVEAFDWLKINYKKPIIYKSDRLEIYYEYAIKLIEKGKAYVCHCLAKKLRENRKNGMECKCRQFPSELQFQRWKEMFNAKEGTATLRIKTNMQHPNPAFRDRVLFRISDRAHPRIKKKYRIWPTLEMSWAIDDHLLGMTHIIRGIDLQIESEMEKYIWDIFLWRKPEIIETGLVNLEDAEGAKLSKSKAQKEVKSGTYTGWADPRTWSIQSLQKRGIKSEAIRMFVKEIGLNKQNISAPIQSLYAINRKLIDAEAERYSFVSASIELVIKNKPKMQVIKVPIHPDKEEKRIVKINKILISKDDFEKFRGKEIRLLHLYNIKLDKKNAEAKFTSEENKEIPKINWVSEYINAKVLMPNGKWISGLAEEAVKELKEDDIIQFERFGFARFDRKLRDIYEFWFAHK